MATKVKTAKTYRKEITKSVGVIHDEILNISDELVEGTITAAGKWQKLWAKAIKNSEPMVSKQMDMMYDTLKTVKGQIKVSGKRIKGLVTDDVDMPTFKVEKTAKKVAKKTVAKARNTAKKAVAKTTAKIANKSKKTVANKKVATPTKRKAAATKKIRKVTADNLKLIEGVGPKLETILLKNGIITYTDLSNTKVATLREILKKAGPRYFMHNPSTWAKQARFAAKGKMTELKKYQATLNNKKK